MKQRWLLVLISLALVVGVVGFAPVGVRAASAGDVLIVEVGADPNSSFTEPAGEFIEIYNTTASTVDVSGWSLCDNSTGTLNGCRTLPPGTSMGSHTILVVMHATTELTGFGCAASVKAVEFSNGWFSGTGANLANTNDHVLLLDASSIQIDQVSYGTDITAFNPAAPDVFNNTGATLQRSTYNTNFVDTNTAGDWAASTDIGTPCDVGPTAITLTTFTGQASTNQSWIVLILLAAGMLILGGWALRRRTRHD